MNFALITNTIALAISFLATLVGMIMSVLLIKQKEPDRLTLVVFPSLMALLNVVMALSIWILALAISSIALITSMIMSVSYYIQKKPGYLAYTSFFALVSIALIFFSISALL